MKKINTFVFLSVFFLAAHLTAQQVTLKVPDMSVQPGTELKIDIQVEDFDQIIGAQFAIYWDQNVLQYLGVDQNSFGLPDVSVDQNFGEDAVQQGKLTFQWNDVTFNGVTLSDMSSLFSVNFKAIGNLNSSTLLELGDLDPPVIPMEFVNLDGVVEVVVDNGNVTIENSSASFETVTDDFVLFQNSPNPFTEVTYIVFNLKHSTPAQFSIYDQAGKVVFEQNAMFAAGKHIIPVKREVFQSSGAYFFTLKTQNAIATRQLIAN